MDCTPFQQCLCMHTHITGWVDCPPPCSKGGTGGCCGAVAWGKADPELKAQVINLWNTVYLWNTWGKRWVDYEVHLANTTTGFIVLNVFVCRDWLKPVVAHTNAFDVEFECALHIHMSDRMMLPAWPAQWVSHIAHRYCHHVHHVCLLSCPIPSPSLSSYVQHWDHTWVTLTDGAGKDSHWDLRWKSHHTVLHMHCYLTRARSTMFYICL